MKGYSGKTFGIDHIFQNQIENKGDSNCVFSDKIKEILLIYI